MLPRQLGHALHDHCAARGTRSGLGPVGVAPRVAHRTVAGDTRGTRACHSARRNRALQKIVTTKHALSCHAHTRHTPRHMVYTWFFPRGKARSCTATQHSTRSYAKLIMPHHDRINIWHASKFVPRQGTLGAASKPPPRCSGPRNSAVESMTLVALSRSAVRPDAVRRYSHTPTQLASLPSPVCCDRSSALSPKPLASLPRPVRTSGGASVRHARPGWQGS